MNDLRATPCVLVIDDNPDDRDEVRQMLLQGGGAGFRVVEASSGVEGLAALPRCPGGRPDFLLLDHDLPDFAAPDMLKRLADGRGQLPCPVVVLTDTDATERGRAALRAGAQDYLSKDWLSPGLLARTLENAAERWAMTRQLHARQAELTGQVERESYLLALAEATRLLDDPQEIKDAAAALLGRQLGASRVVYAEPLPDGRLQVAGGYADGVAPIDGHYRLSDFGAQMSALLQQGQPVVVNDMATAPQFTDAQKASYAAMRIAAHIGVPLLGNGRLVALLAVHQDRPRAWTPADVELATQTLARTLIGITLAKSQVLLREREERLAQLVELMPSFNAVVRGDDEVLELANEPFCALAGCGPEALGRPLRDVLPAFGEPPFAGLLAAVHRNGQPFRAHGLQVRLGRPAGGREARDERFVDLACIPLRDLAGEVDGVLIHGVDRTDQVLAERALRESRRELQGMADNLPAVVARFDTGLRHLFVNAAAEAVTGRPRHDFIGRTNQEIGLSPTLAAAWDAGLRAVFADGQARTQEFRFPTPAGERDFRTRLVPERDASGDVRTLLAVTYDVTDERASERALQESARQKDLFLATLAHELRNPMAPLRSGLELLARQALPQPATQVVGMMNRQLSHLVNLVDDLLDLSRVNLGKIELHRQTADVDDAVAAALEACRPQLDARDHRLALAPRGPAPLVVQADWTRLVQIVVNLLSNAAKYTPPGGEITVSTTREGDEAVVRVQDTGVGLEAATLPHIWGMFSQVENTRDKSQGGLGIGLWLTRHLAELHGGSVAAFSEGLGRGSTFVVRLPVSAAVPAAGAGGSPASPGRLAAPARILIVDDSPDNAASLAALLRSLGHDVVVAHSGGEALALLPRVNPALMLLDIGMPGMDGHEVARRLRASNGPQPLLVAVTGWGSDDDRRRSAEAGFDLHLTKPVQLASIEALFATAPPGPVPGGGSGQDSSFSSTSGSTGLTR